MMQVKRERKNLRGGGLGGHPTHIHPLLKNIKHTHRAEGKNKACLKVNPNPDVKKPPPPPPLSYESEH